MYTAQYIVYVIPTNQTTLLAHGFSILVVCIICYIVWRIYIYIYIYTIQFLGPRTFSSAQPSIKKGAIKQKNTNFIGNNNRFALRSSSGYKN